MATASVISSLPTRWKALLASRREQLSCEFAKKPVARGQQEKRSRLQPISDARYATTSLVP